MNKPICPGCGKEMVWVEPNAAIPYYWFSCDACFWKSPWCNTEDEARAAALRRYVEPNRVLTLEEVMQVHPDGATCVEERKTGAIEVILNCEILEEFAEVVREGGQDAAEQAYGRFSRAWLRRPTDVEREAVAWE